ncbi:hypothetical protein D9619_007446 [Psilocybe cf. subviscida]|uniref:Uncharacterized protein n=1 Tax=Psilocybe cf. subviscida TaxID=2480587 RepID=A0A8H5B2F7_9AGAR|nr:hypothetical protein D9619_007446 [Psilocybe cf. subviscida]
MLCALRTAPAAHPLYNLRWLPTLHTATQLALVDLDDGARPPTFWRHSRGLLLAIYNTAYEHDRRRQAAVIIPLPLYTAACPPFSIQHSIHEYTNIGDE